MSSRTPYGTGAHAQRTAAITSLRGAVAQGQGMISASQRQRELELRELEIRHAEREAAEKKARRTLGKKYVKSEVEPLEDLLPPDKREARSEGRRKLKEVYDRAQRGAKEVPTMERHAYRALILSLSLFPNLHNQEQIMTHRGAS